MPALIHCSKYGAHKARLATMPMGAHTYAATRAEANGLYHAARAMGFRVSVQSGEAALRVTLLRGRTAEPLNR